MEYMLLRAFTDGVFKVVSRKTVLKMADSLSAVFYELTNAKRVCRENLRFVGMPQSLARESVKFFTKAMFDFFKSADYDEAFIRSLFFMEKKSVENYKKLLSLNSAILLTAHIGNWELMGNWFSIDSGGRLSVVAKPLKNYLVNDFVNSLRERFGQRVIPTGKPKRIISDLKRGRFVAILLDQRPKRSEGVLTSFLGRATYTNKGAAVLSKKLNVPVVPAFCFFKDDRYEIEVGSPIYPGALSVSELTQLYTEQIEKAVLKHPEQWLWSHRRWKNSPEFKSWKETENV